MNETTAELLARADRLLELQQNIDYYDKKIAELRAKISPGQSTPSIIVESSEEPKPKTAQEIYQIAQRGGSEWQSVLNEVSQLWQ